MNKSFIKITLLITCLFLTLSCGFDSAFFRNTDKKPIQSPQEIKPTSISNTTQPSSVSPTLMPEATNTLSPFGCDKQDLTEEEKINCGTHEYTYTAESICPEAKMSKPTGSEKSTFIFKDNKLILNTETIKDAEKESLNTYQGIAHISKGNDWNYNYKFNIDGYTLKTQDVGDDRFCFVYHYTFADEK